jgi:hypothetical protein
VSAQTDILFDVVPHRTQISHGVAKYLKPRGRARGEWHIAVKPYVMILLKRVFPRVRTTTSQVVVIAHSPSVAAELTWFMQRYHLDLDPESRAVLDGSTAAHYEREAQTQAILAGHHLSGVGMRTMADQTLREYQQTAADLISANKRVLIGDQLGLGKTLSGLSSLRNPDALPAAIVVQTHLAGQWERYCQRVWPDFRTHVARKAKPYDMAKYGGAPDVLILSYSKLDGWRDHLAGEARTVIFDEVQDLRNGTETLKGEAAAHIAGMAEYVVGLTATPVYNYGGEMHSIMQIIAPGALGDRDEFLREWGGRSWQTQGGSTQATVADPRALGLYLRDQGLMLARTRQEVGRELPYGEPEKVPHVIDADTAVLDKMAGNAVEMARLILAKTTSSAQRFTASGEFDTMLRQATGLAKAPFAATFVEGLLETEDRVVLWGWHHAVYDVWAERLAKYGVVRYTGHESPTQKQAALDRFTKSPDEADSARVLVMSLRSGAGIDGLQEHCSVGVFGELDWSPKVMDQCLGRLARDGQESEVIGYYLMADHGADPAMVEALELKHGQSAPIENPHADIVTALPAAGQRVKDLARSILRQHGQDIPEESTDD